MAVNEVPKTDAPPATSGELDWITGLIEPSPVVPTAAAPANNQPPVTASAVSDSKSTSGSSSKPKDRSKRESRGGHHKRDREHKKTCSAFKESQDDGNYDGDFVVTLKPKKQLQLPSTAAAPAPATTEQSRPPLFIVGPTELTDRLVDRSAGTCQSSGRSVVGRQRRLDETRRTSRQTGHHRTSARSDCQREQC